LGKCG